MKSLLILCGLFLLPLLGRTQVQTDHITIIPGEKVEVIFDNKLTEADLDNFQFILKAHDILLTYEERSFDEDGNLKSIEFSVDCQDGFSGTATAESLGKKDKVGFVRDYREGARSPFRVGKM